MRSLMAIAERKPAPVYSILEHPDWLAAQAKLVELQAKRADLEREIAECLGHISRAPDAENPREIAALDFLDSGRMPAAADLEVMRRRYGDMYREKAVVAQAILIHQQRMSQLRGLLSRKVCEDLQDEHRHLVSKVIEAVIALGLAREAEANFRHKLDAGNVSHAGHLRPMLFASGDLPVSVHSRIAAFLTECIEHQFLDRKAIPSHWWENWTR